MSTALPQELAREGVRRTALKLSRERVLPLAALALIVALAVWLRFADLARLGYANHYYSAAVKSMLESWHNFFFVAAEPGGSVSVDKPPVGLWLQVASAALLGVNTLGVLLPEILAGIGSVLVLYHLVQRRWGAAAGLLAALALAITPVVVATDRNNTIDSPLIFTLLLAAWAFIRATEEGRLRFLLLGALLVGIGFNIKMLEAYLPLPAFYALYFFGSKESLWRKLGNLTIAGVLLLVVSFAWPVAVDMVPAGQRPYVGSSSDNSELSLIFGYNGLNRLLGMRIGRGNPGNARTGPFGGVPQGGGVPPLPQGGPFPRGGRGRGGLGGFGGFGALGGTGQPGALRLLVPPLSKEASWLLPFGALGALLLLARTRLHWPVAPEHQAVLLWGGWLATAGIFFSVAGFFHEYYLSTMAPPLAALVGIGAVALWRMRAQHPWQALALLMTGGLVTLAVQTITAAAFVSLPWWLPLAVGLFLIGGLLLLGAAQLPTGRLAQSGFACVMAAMLITPGIWSGLTTFNSSANQSLPAAYAGTRESTGPANFGRPTVNQALLDYLQAHTQGMQYLVAVPSSMQGADYVLATGRPVLYMGGFMGQDRVVTPDDLSRLVSQGQLRYLYWNSIRAGFGAQSDISAWVSSRCTVVPGFDTNTRNAGAPDGTGSQTQPGSGFPQPGGGVPGGMGEMQVSLYDCASGR